MSKDPQKLTATNQRPKAAETNALETVKATVMHSPRGKSAWSLTKIQASSDQPLK